MTQQDAPKQIWLQWGGDALDEYTWCQDQVSDDDVPYIRSEGVEDELIRVYRMPAKTDGFCFGGGRPQTCVNLDWFCNIINPETGRCGTPEEVVEYIKQKNYYQPGLLVLSKNWARIA